MATATAPLPPAPATTLAQLPPFPTHDSLPEVHLARLPLSKLLAQDGPTEQALFAICQSHGFFYLDLSETDRGAALLNNAARLQAVAAQAFQLPRADKEAIHQSVSQTMFGWKASGAVAAADPFRRKDVGEFFNVAKDDIWGLDHGPHIPYPSPLREELPTTFHDFVEDAHATGLLVLRALARKLGVDPRAMDQRHAMENKSGDHVRLTWGPGDPHATDERLQTRREADTRVNVFGHTDFGSVTILFNWLGGLQMEDPQSGPGSEDWKWVRPVPGHAICNLGDAMVVFSGGRLKSGKHRVVDAPGAQAALERHSLVYFVRPHDDVRMEDLTAAGGQGDTGYTAGDWIRKRALEMGNSLDQKPPPPPQ